jgi:hypothetical protein
VFHFEVSISHPDWISGKVDLGFSAAGRKSKSHAGRFSDALDVKSVRSGTSENDAVSDCCLSLAERDVGV